MRMIFLILAVAIAGQMRAETVIETAPRPVRFTTRDSIELAATYYHPISSNPVPAVILLHSYGKNSEEWGAVASLFQMNQVAALALDLRGHGASTHRLTANGTETVDYHNFTPQDYTAMLLDINQAYDWLASQPGIDKHRIAVVGSSIGANLGGKFNGVPIPASALTVLPATITVQPDAQLQIAYFQPRDVTGMDPYTGLGSPIPFTFGVLGSVQK